MTFSSFQDIGKWVRRRQWLNKCVKCTNGRLGRCWGIHLECHQFRRPFSISRN
jgi:hypothetical protein